MGYNYQSEVVVSSPKSGLATAALIVGIFAILTCWVPLFGVLLGLVGAGLSIGALVRRQSKGLSITGLVLSSLGLLLAVLITTFFFLSGAGDSSLDEGGAESQSEGVDASSTPATETCLTAGETASAALAELYDTHPLWDTEYPGTDASAEEQAAYDALQADEQAQWDAMMAPLYTSCGSPGDLYALFLERPDLVGFTRSDAFDSTLIEAWCYDPLVDGAPACSGWEEWVAANS